MTHGFRREMKSFQIVSGVGVLAIVMTISLPQLSLLVAVVAIEMLTGSALSLGGNV
jgi:hypothetical protein